MAGEPQKRFSLHINALPRDAFFVTRFMGREEFSSLFNFEITAVSERHDVKPDEVLNSSATLILHGRQGDVEYQGRPASFEVIRQAGQYLVYRIELVPRAWLLTMNKAARIYLNQTLPQFTTEALKAGGLAEGQDFELKLSGSYPAREFVCQYNESYYDFVSRWFERDGIYFFFDHQTGKMIATDSSQAHVAQDHLSTLSYHPPSGLAGVQEEEAISRLSVKRKPAPKNVTLKEWNYRKPDLELKTQSQVLSSGLGEIHFYGDHFLDKSEGDRLAQVRSEEFLCRAERCQGQSTAPYLRVGYTFSLEGHFRQESNQKHLVIQIAHEGSQEGYLSSELGMTIDTGAEDYYRNNFTAISAGLQFRPERRTPKPRFYGVMNAHVDAEGSGQYADVDEHGRYSVILPFDLSGRKNGKASHRLRMAQPYTGEDHGLHFPLHKGVEVLLTCIDGDPDRPIISGAAPNPEFPSQITDKNQTQATITSGGQNRIHIEDREGEQRILLHSPTENSFLRLGSPNDPPGGYYHDEDNPLGITLSSNGSIQVKCGCWNKTIIGNSSSTYLGLDHTTVGGLQSSLIMGFEIGLLLGTGNLLQNVHPMRNKMYDTKAAVQKSKKKIAEQETKLWQTRSEIAQRVTGIAQDTTELAEQKAKLAQEITKLARQKLYLSEQKTKVAEESLEVIQEKTTLAQQKSKLAQNINKLAQDHFKIVEDINDLNDDITELVGDVDDLCEEVVEMSEEIIETGGESMELLEESLEM